MEKSLIQIAKIEPMAKPPPLRNKCNDSDVEVKQWIQDAKYAVMQQLETDVNTKISRILEYKFKARNTVDINKKIHDYVLRHKMNENSTYRTRYAQP